KSTSRTQSKHVRFPWRTRKHRCKDLTEQQKKDLKEAREKKKNDLRNVLVNAHNVIWDLALQMEKTFGGHKPRYYFHLILQNVLSIKKGPRKLTLWNAYVSIQLKELNKGQSLSMIQRVNLGPAIKRISQSWNAMTPQEQEAIAGEELQRLIEHHQSKIFGVHNIQQTACNDTHGVLTSISRQLQELHGRTGNEFLLFAVRVELKDTNPRFVFYTGEHIADYMKNITKESVEDTCVRLEAYSILSQDEETSLRGNIPKMFYINFEDHITTRFGLVLENWPLKKFAAPGSLSRIELEVLLNAWQNGVMRFHDLTDDEWKEW
ncbi:hypothetical protein C8Q74DRAFT_1156238, partial [Fomes fomentarius]